MAQKDERGARLPAFIKAATPCILSLTQCMMRSHTQANVAKPHVSEETLPLGPCGYLHASPWHAPQSTASSISFPQKGTEDQDIMIPNRSATEQHRNAAGRTMQNTSGPESDRDWRQDDSRRGSTCNADRTAAFAESTSSGDTQRAHEPFQGPATEYVKCISCHDLEHLVGEVALSTAALLQRRSASVWGYAMLQMDANNAVNAINTSSNKLDDLREQIYETLEELKRHCSGCDFYRRSMSPYKAHQHQMATTASDQLVERVRNAVAAMDEEALNTAAEQRGYLEGWIAHVDQAARLAKDDMLRLRQGITTLGAALSRRHARSSSAPPAMPRYNGDAGSERQQHPENQRRASQSPVAPEDSLAEPSTHAQPSAHQEHATNFDDGSEIQPGGRQKQNIEEAISLSPLNQLYQRRDHAAHRLPSDIMRTAATSALEASKYDEGQKCAYLANMVQGTARRGDSIEGEPAGWRGKSLDTAASVHSEPSDRRRHRDSLEAISASTAQAFGAGGGADAKGEGGYESEGGDTLDSEGVAYSRAPYDFVPKT